MTRLLNPCCPVALCVLLLLLLFTPQTTPSPQRDGSRRKAMKMLRRIFNAAVAQVPLPPRPTDGPRAQDSASPSPALSLLPSTATRTCPPECDDTFRPVCASDGKSYRNECVLRRVICRNDEGLHKRHDGPCTSRPTSPTPSSRPSSSRCREECTKIYTPVCGSDGVTYNNPCILEAESCKKKEADPTSPTVTKVHDGACESSPQNECYEKCSSSFQPICGTDDLTYHNKCEMRVAICVSEGSVRQRYEGVCAVPAGSSSGSSREQSSGLRPSLDLAETVALAVVTSGPRCEDECLAGFRPVCGSNGVTYGSQCLLEVAKCKDPTLSKANDGVCTKDCTIQCPSDSSPVCGTNGITYLNDCYLIIDQCKDGSIRKVSSGACGGPPVREACELRCTTDYNPVCGSNGITYTNACRLQAATCELLGLVQLYKGQCRQ